MRTHCAHPLARRPGVLMARQHAVSVPTSLLRGREEAAGTACRRVLSLSTLAPRRAACWPKFGARGVNERQRVRVGASEHGRIGGVLGACRGVGGGVRGPWLCHWHAKITQGRRVGELEPESYFLGAGGQFHVLVKRRKNRLRASRARSGGASGRAQHAAFARHARRRLAGLARRAGRGRADCT